ncbi:translocation protein sec62 [Ceraceosorus guamensis]|uniref:Translocation protein SEC62 n=1 Tax=Ceraceosorus guamensis TaxID=1522189 RepID=A0A316VQ55_9BASI|nr:translocation protein sec62 [Ceraceosorus guamensis]PWN39384.1 translocation protein sec62 [Ceraceosorus guamensis]
MEQQSSAPPWVRSLVDFLRSSSTGPKTKVGLLNGQRKDHFKGSGAIKSLLSPAYVKAQAKKGSVLPKIENEDQAAEALHNVIPYAFFLRVDRATEGGKERPIQINQMQMFKSDLYYVWLYDGSQLLMQLAGFGMILLMLAGVMFPLWPASLRVGVWYLSIGVLGLIGAFFGLAIVRLILWGISKVVLSPGIWLFPNLFEDVGFVDSFIPLWAWDLPPAPKKVGKKKRAHAIEGSEGEAIRDKVEGGKGAGSKQQAVANLPGQESGPAKPQLSAAQAAGDSAPAQQSKSTDGKGGNVKKIQKASDNLAGLD